MIRQSTKKAAVKAEPANDPPLLVSVAANKGAVMTNARAAEASCMYILFMALLASALLID